MSDKKLFKILEMFEGAEITAEKLEMIKEELGLNFVHDIEDPEDRSFLNLASQVYGRNCLSDVQGVSSSPTLGYRSFKSLDDLLDRDAQREKDGLRRKINIGRIVKPTKGGNNKVVVVPTTSEDKFYHDTRVTEAGGDKKSGSSGSSGGDTGEATGTAEGEEGDIIGERPLHSEGDGEGGTGAGQSSGGEHDVVSNAYDLGRILTEKFHLPNLKNKGKKKSISKYIFDLTDCYRGAGQVLDKKKTIKQIIKTNIALGRVDSSTPVDLQGLLINPRDYIYRTLSREKDYESQAVVFFVRDYSGSMYGKPTEIVCSQHVMIYSWLLFQYSEQVQTRFILHDTESKEVKDFYTYHNMNVAGGTQIRAAFELVNKIVEDESLAKDNNIYVFYGGDGDDWNSNAKLFKQEFEKMLSYVNRLGITIVKSAFDSSSKSTDFENFLRDQKILENNKDLVHLDVMTQDVDDKRIVEGIKSLVS